MLQNKKDYYYCYQFIYFETFTIVRFCPVILLLILYSFLLTLLQLFACHLIKMQTAFLFALFHFLGKRY